MSDPTFRPRTATELVDAAVRLLRLHFGSYVLIAALAALPGLVANTLILADAGWGSDAAALVAASNTWTGTRLLVSLLGLVTYAMAESVYVRFTADAHHGMTTSLGEAARIALPRTPAVLFGMLLRGVAMGLATLALVFPGLLVLVRTSLAPQANVLEDAGSAHGLSRSWALTKGSALRVTGAIGLAWLLFIVVLIGLQMVAGILSAIGGSGTFLMASYIVSTLGMALVYPLIPVISTLVYYDLRIRREGLDLELLADDLAPVATPG